MDTGSASFSFFDGPDIRSEVLWLSDPGLIVNLRFTHGESSRSIFDFDILEFRLIRVSFFILFDTFSALPVKNLITLEIRQNLYFNLDIIPGIPKLKIVILGEKRDYFGSTLVKKLFQPMEYTMKMCY